MKILQVIDQVGEAYGGSANAARNIARALSDRGHEVTIYSSNAGVYSSIPHLKTYRTLFSYKNSIRITPGLLFAKFGDFDIVHCHNYYTFQNLVVALRVWGIPTLLQPHGSLVRYDELIRKLRPGHKLVDALWHLGFVYRLSGLVCVSDIEINQAIRLGVPDSKIFFIPNGIDYAEYEHLPAKGLFRQRYGISQETKVILYLGRLHWLKGIDYLVKAFASLRGQNARLVIAGSDDGIMAKIQELIGKFQLDSQVLLTGPLYGREKLEAYVDANVYVLPSRYDIFGITVMEALACGTPVIVSEHCGISSIATGRVGQVFKDSDDLAKALKKAVSMKDNESDRKLRRELARQYDWAGIAGKLEAIYELIRQPGSKANQGNADEDG